MHIFLQVWQNCSCCVNWNVLRIHGSYKKKLCSSSLNNQRIFQLRFETKIMGLSKMHFTCNLEYFEKNTFSKKLYRFLNQFRQWAKKFRFLSGKIPAGTSILHSKFSLERVQEKNFREKTRCSSSSAQWRRNIGLLSKQFRPDCQNCFQLVYGKTLKVNKLIENIYIYIYMLFLFGLYKKNSVSRQINFGSVAKTAFTVSNGNFWAQTD